MFYIYKAENKVNGKCYIGMTNDVNCRAYTHKITAYSNPKCAIDKAIKEYGIENFTWKQIESCKTEKEAREREKYYIQLFKTNVIGYNSPNFYGASRRNMNPKKESDNIAKTITLHKNIVKQIEIEAKNNMRSFSSEILYRLEKSLKAEGVTV